MHRDQKIAATTAEKGGYTAIVKNIYGAPPPTPEEHHEVIEDIQTILQGIQIQGYEIAGMTQDNAVLISSNYVVIAQLAQMNVTMNTMQAQLNTLSSAQTNQTRPNRKHYCWSCGSNYTHCSKT